MNTNEIISKMEMALNDAQKYSDEAKVWLKDMEYAESIGNAQAKAIAANAYSICVNQARKALALYDKIKALVDKALAEA